MDPNQPAQQPQQPPPPQQPQWSPPPQQPMGWGGPGYGGPPPRPTGVTLASIFLIVMGVLSSPSAAQPAASSAQEFRAAWARRAWEGSLADRSW